MVVNVQRYFALEKKEDKFVLSENDLYHINTVMRMHDGDKVEVVHNNELYICELCDNLAKILTKESTTNNKKARITLVIPLLKEQKMDLILQKATELGVDEIVPVIMERSIVKFDSSKEDKKLARWRKICKEASEQSKRLDIPEVTRVLKMEELKSFNGVKLTCSTSEKSENIKKYLKKQRNYDKIILVIGPEGGLSKQEEEYLKTLDFVSVSLGNLIMRVETVPLFLLSALNYELME